MFIIITAADKPEHVLDVLNKSFQELQQFKDNKANGNLPVSTQSYLISIDNSIKTFELIRNTYNQIEIQEKASELIPQLIDLKHEIEEEYNNKYNFSNFNKSSSSQ